MRLSTLEVLFCLLMGGFVLALPGNGTPTPAKQAKSPVCQSCVKQGRPYGRIYEIPSNEPAHWNRYYEDGYYHLHDIKQQYQCANGHVWLSGICWCGRE